ncbi:MAG TPA: DUF2264 domain-containing protein, partial [Ruminiclostridium sp.]|nr:DUF2264 domain-containing protein [Ruminiclostridium sp.]
MIVCRQGNDSHVIAYTAGQHAEFEPAHGAAKYEKFAYSNIFGFSVPRGNYGLDHGAYDSMLALSEGDNYYRVRRKCDDVRIEENCIFSRWKPWNEVEIQTWIIPYETNHVRIHKIKTLRELDTAEGGFAISREDGSSRSAEVNVTDVQNIAIVDCPWGTSGIINLIGDRTSEIVRAESNSNLIKPRTWIPTLKSHLKPGEHILACLVIGNTKGAMNKKNFEDLPM